MGTLSSAYIFPHPPIIVPEIGGGEEEKANVTINGCRQAAKDIKEKEPETIIMITPHGPAFRDAVSISVQEDLRGSFRNFRRPDVHLGFKNDLQVVENILEQAGKHGIAIAQLNPELVSRFGISTELDHGAMVPLYYISKEWDRFKLVHICMGFLTQEELFSFGKAIAQAVEQVDRKVVMVASGDLSHRLTREAPCGYSSKGKEFDDLLVGLLGKGDFKGIMSIEENLIEEAGECGLRPFTILFGALSRYSVETRVLSYEGPFGVGYCVAKLEVRS